MADTITNTSELKLTCLFDDDDTRVISFDNPVSGLGKSDILAIQNDMVAYQPIIGDKTGAAFVKFNKAQIVDKSVIKLDLS